MHTLQSSRGPEQNVQSSNGHLAMETTYTDLPVRQPASSEIYSLVAREMTVSCIGSRGYAWLPPIRWMIDPMLQRAVPPQQAFCQAWLVCMRKKLTYWECHTGDATERDRV